MQEAVGEELLCVLEEIVLVYGGQGAFVLMDVLKKLVVCAIMSQDEKVEFCCSIRRSNLKLPRQ